MRARYTEDWTADGYRSLIPVSKGEGLSTQWVMPIEMRFGALIREISVRTLAVTIVCVASLSIAAAIGLSRGGLAALAVAFAGYAVWELWRCSYIPHRERIVATRDGSDLVVTYTSGVSRSIRIDLSTMRFASVEMQLRGGPAGWMIQFGSTPDRSEIAFDLEGLRMLPGEQQRWIYNSLLQSFIGNAFNHIEALAESSQSRMAAGLAFPERSQRDRESPGPIQSDSAHSISKS